MVLFIIYLVGIAVAMLTVILFRETILKGSNPPFVLELPPYRMPTVKGVILTMWERSRLYLRKAGTTILAVSILMWALFAFPVDPVSSGMHEPAPGHLKNQAGSIIPADVPEERSAGIRKIDSTNRLSRSLGGRIGRAVEPLFRPLGFDWRINIAIISAFAAKEVFVATMGQIYSLSQEERDNPSSLISSIKADPVWTPRLAVGVMLFVLLSSPCMAAIAITRAETNSWKWAGIMTAYTTSVAYFVSLLWYQGLSRLIC